MKGKPELLAYVVDQINQNEAFWTCIGVAFPHKDQKGMNLVLRALPVGKQIVLRRYTGQPVTKEPIPEVENS